MYSLANSPMYWLIPYLWEAVPLELLRGCLPGYIPYLWEAVPLELLRGCLPGYSPQQGPRKKLKFTALILCIFSYVEFVCLKFCCWNWMFLTILCHNSGRQILLLLQSCHHNCYCRYCLMTFFFVFLGPHPPG